MTTPDGATTTPDGATTAATRASRLTRGRAVVLVLVAGLLALGVAALPWARASVPTVLAEREVSVTGEQATTVTFGLALLVLAAGLAVVLGGRWVVLVAAVLILASGVAYVTAAAVFLVDPLPSVLAAAAEVSGVPQITGAPTLTPWAYLAVAAGLGMIATAFVVHAVPTARGGRRFERSGSTPATRTPARDDRTRAMDDWDALGRGEDPTVSDPG